MCEETLRYSPRYARQTVQIENAEALAAAVSSGGAILAAVHYGSYFLIAGAIHQQLGMQATGIVTFNNVAIMPESERRTWLDMYQRAIELQGRDFFYAGKSSKNEIVEFLKVPHRVLWSMLDVREFGRERPEFPFDFLGGGVYLQLGTARLAKSANVPMIPVCIRYDAAKKRHHLHIGEAIPPDLDERAMTQQALWQIQALIRDDMTQFFHDIKDFSRPSLASEKANGFGILFDQFSRYKACEELLSRAGVVAGDTLLDIGSGPEMLFDHFLPGVNKTFLDPLVADDGTGKRIQGDLHHPSLVSRRFTVVSAIDVLEHVPPAARTAFLEQMSSRADKSLILGFPVAEGGIAREADESIDAQYERIYGNKYSWLDEHYRYGLPSLKDTVAILETHGWSCQCIGHGYVPWLKELLPLVISAWHVAAFHDFLLEASRRFNTEFYPFEFEAPHYRYFVVCTRSSVPQLTPAFRGDLVAANERFQTFIAELRDAYHALSLRLLTDTDRDRFVARDALGCVQAERDLIAKELDAIVRSRSWRITRPLRALTRLRQQGVTSHDLQRLFEYVRPWYRRLPIPAPLRQRIGRILRRTLTGWLIPRPGPWTPPDTSIRIAPPESSQSDYVIFGVIDWNFRHQRPQQMAQQLAASARRVFYISVGFIDSDEPGFTLEPLDASGRLFNLRLYLHGAPSVYDAPPGTLQSTQLLGGIGLLLGWAGAESLVALVQHPYWYRVAAFLPNSRLVYDCMDHHEGFGGVTPELIANEQALFAHSDLTVTTSLWLDAAVEGKAKRHVQIRNAADFTHFAAMPATVYKDPEGRRIIGYYGAIAEWFDTELVAVVADAFRDCAVLLIGADTVDAQRKLARHRNVIFLGEIPYQALPHYAHAFDVCLLPFKVIPLTLATNPVKVYEYLSMGKPVVSVDLPEVCALGGLCQVAATADDFVAAVGASLATQDAAEVVVRQDFARGQTWSHRAASLIEAAESSAADPNVSVVVVTYNNLALTKACLSSLDELTGYAKLELIVVDNASSDGSPEWLRDWVQAGPDRQLILNEDNRGFAAGNNQGLRAARGEYLVMLNNDTYVTPGWVRTLVNHMRRNPDLGLLGPVTNNIGNEARIEIVYGDMPQMIARAGEYTRRHMGQLLPLRTAAFFCVMLRRETFDRIGPLDEAFGRGFFEDDDYCRRIEQAGLRIACAEDVFIHHQLSASFNKLRQQDRQRLFDENKRTYEAKWGPWTPHSFRAQAATDQAQTDWVPEAFRGQQYVSGQCVICGKRGQFFYRESALWRESLNCQHCLATSRYRSLARGVLRAIDELTGVTASSLTTLPRSNDKKLKAYDTQPPFYYAPCAYPLPDILKATRWIDVALSNYKPGQPMGSVLARGITNQNLECLTFADASLDIVITSDVMEHVRLDDRAHREIYRVLKPGGVYLFTVPHDRSWEQTLTRVQVNDPDDPSKDVQLLDPEYHGDTNSDDPTGVLAYRTYGRDLEHQLAQLGFMVDYTRDDIPDLAILNTELYYCKKAAS